MVATNVENKKGSVDLEKKEGVRGGVAFLTERRKGERRV